jgi:threonine/homoserine/homoserine lactone efflux protein
MSGQSESEERLRKLTNRERLLAEEVFDLKRELAKLRRFKKEIEDHSLKGRLLSLIHPSFYLFSLIVLIYVWKDVAESKMSGIRFLGVFFSVTMLFALFVLCVLRSTDSLKEVHFRKLFRYSLQIIFRGLRSLLKREQ